MGSENRGFALLIVLWSLVLIGLLTTQIMASGRMALALAGNVKTAAQARAAADGAIYAVIFHLCLEGADHWEADDSVHELAVGGIPVTVRVASLGGMINPNLASTALLAGLFQAVGADAAQAQQIAQAITQWRSPPLDRQQMQAELAAYRLHGLPYGPPGHGFADLSELADLANMPPALLARAMPYLSLFQSEDPDPAQAGPVVRRALALSGQAGSSADTYSGSFPVVMVQALAGTKGRLTLRRQAFVSIIGQNGAEPFRLLSLTDAY